MRCFMADNKATPPEEAGPVAAAEAALDRLAARLRAPSIGAQIRRLLPKIETAIESGATHEQIVETLRESGIDISLLTFRSAFYRARAKAAKDSRKGESGGGPKARTAAGKAPKATARRGSRRPATRWRCPRVPSPSTGTRRRGRK